MDDELTQLCPAKFGAVGGRPKRIMVTGGSGFIGSHLTRRLLDEGNEILVVDNFYSSSRQNLIDLIGHPHFELMRHDVTFPLYVEVDEIYHLACPASPIFYQRDPVQTTKTCVHGSINMLGLAKRTGAKILLSSTSEVYGDPATHPQHESYWGNVNPVGPRSCYDEGKRCAETLFFDYYRQHATADQGRAHLQHLRAEHAAQRRSRGVQLHRPGAAGRAADRLRRRLADPLVLLRRRPGRRADPADGLADDVTGPINLGNPGEFTMLELAEQVIAMVGNGGGIEYRPLPVDDPVRRRPDIGQAREVLDWSPTVALQDGLDPTVEFFRDLLFT